MVTQPSKSQDAPKRDGFVQVRGAREHNLKNITVDIPRDALVVFTGVSGSGKSSLAFGTLYAEAQRRYLESVSPYSHLTGHYPGGQAEYVRVPFADVCPTKVPEGLTDEQVLFLTDIFPTGFQGAKFAEIEDGDTVAVWGCGPVGQFCIRSAQMLGAGHVVAIDLVPERLALAAAAGAETINFEKEDVYERLNQITKGRGPDRCIDAVGMEVHGHGTWDSITDRALAATGLGTDRCHVLRDCLRNVRAGGTVSLSGVYGGFLNMVPLGAAFQKGITIRMGQCNVLNYMDELMTAIEEGKIDPSFVITHRCGLEDGPKMYETFKKKQDGCIKVVMKPHSH